MNRGEARQEVRDIIRNNLPSGVVTGNWSDDKLNRYLSITEEYAFYKEIDIDRSRFLATDTITCDGNELQDLPSDPYEFERFVSLRNTSDTGPFAVEYRLINFEMRNNYLAHTESGLACYLFGTDQIGVLPIPVTGTSLTSTFIRKYVPMDDDSDCELHILSQRVMNAKAAMLALGDRSDVNVNLIAAELKDREKMMLKMKRHSRAPFELTPFGVGYPSDQPFIFT